MARYQINETAANALAQAANLAVSKTKRETLDGRLHWGKPVVRNSLTVGRAVCYHETDIGGAACWRIELDGVMTRGGYKGETIAKAVRLQVGA